MEIDYEKAYKEALERAKRLRDSKYQTMNAKRVVEEIFPVLAESEDERIRKAIVATIEQCPYDFLNPKNRDKMLAYLEKQKDASKAIEAVDRIDKYIDEHVANAHDMKDSNPDKKYYLGWDDALAKMSGILQDVYSDEKQKESLHIPETCKENADSFTDACKDVIVAIEKYLDWLTGYPDYAPKGKYSLRDMLHCLYVLEKQKEQKPNIEICPHSIKSKSYKERGYPIEDCDYGLEIALQILKKTLGKVEGYQTDDGLREHQTAMKAVKDAMKEQKPPIAGNDFGWIDELKHDLKHPEELDEKVQEVLKKRQKPVEWSEEDEKTLDCIINILDRLGFEEFCKSSRDQDIEEERFYYKEIQFLKRLKSLRPSWKPSEEQMSALNYFIKLWGNSDEQLEYTKIFNTVKSLRDDLKKLGVKEEPEYY